MTNTAFLLSQDGNITLFHNNKTHLIQPNHARYADILKALTNEEFERLDDLVEISRAAEERMGDVEIIGGQVFYKGQPAHGLITQRIIEFMQADAPFKHLMRFLDNLMSNPSRRAVTELYSFLEHGGFPITPDGCFIAYKGVSNEYKDLWTHAIDNSVGAKPPRMERNQVCDDPTVACSDGYHVGTINYADDYARYGRVMLVKVNPADAVSVPIDHNCQKLRVCYYEVIAEHTERTKIAEPTYGEDEEDEYGEDEDCCEKCGEDYWGCYCSGDESPEEEETLPDLPDEATVVLEEYREAPIVLTDESDWTQQLPPVEEATGRRRGAGGRFLPKNG